MTVWQSAQLVLITIGAVSVLLIMLLSLLCCLWWVTGAGMRSMTEHDER